MVQLYGFEFFGMGKQEQMLDQTYGSFLRFPEDFLTSEQKEEHEKLLKKAETAEKEKKDCNPRPHENWKFLEVLLWWIVFKLLKTSFVYQILLELIEQQEFEKIGQIFEYNASFFKTMKDGSEKAKLDVLKQASWRYGGPTFAVKVNLDEIKNRIASVEGTKGLASDLNIGKPDKQITVEIPPEKVERNQQRSVDTLEDQSKCIRASDKGNIPCQNSNEEEKTMSPKNIFKVIAHGEKMNALVAETKDFTENSDLKKSSKRSEKPKQDSSFFERMLSEISCPEHDKEVRKTIEEVKKQAEIEMKKFKQTKQTLEKEEKLRALTRKAEEAKRAGKEAELQKILEEQRREQEVLLEKLRKERRRIEEEAREAHHQMLKNFRRMTNEYCNCIALKLHWDEKEQEWAKWLNALRTSVAKAKIQYLHFENSAGSFVDLKKLDKRDFEMELSILQHETLLAYDLLFDSFSYISELSKKVPDRIFLRILMRNIQIVCDKMCRALQHMQNISIDESSMKALKSLYDQFDTSDILSTKKLLEVSKTARPEIYSRIDDPMKLSEDSVKIEEF